MARLPTLKGQEVVRALEQAGFQIVRRKGSHVRMKHADGRVVTVAHHRKRCWKLNDGLFAPGVAPMYNLSCGRIKGSSAKLAL